MEFPLAYLLTWTTYGSWLPGDESGSHDAFGNYIIPNKSLHASSEDAMSEAVVVLTDVQREIVDARLIELCQLGDWILHARNVRIQHVHAVVSAALDGDVLRARLKAGCSMSLSQHAGLEARGQDGAKKSGHKKGNVEEIWTGRHLYEAIAYVNERQ